MSPVRLTGIVVYPLKSAGGVSLRRARVERHGLALDRRWMLVDEDGTFLSQRELPRMALIRVRIETDRLRIRAPGHSDLELDLHPGPGRAATVGIWGDRVEAQSIGADEDAWFRSFLGRDVHLVHIPERGFRQVDLTYAKAGDQVGFADGYPFLLASETSLAALNERLPAPLPMNRFRPNLIVSGTAPFAEDAWDRIRVNGVTFRVVKPCARCSITTVDQETGVTGKEPLRTLATFRRGGGKVLFGQNLVHDGTGIIETGTSVALLHRDS